ncbi:hypothetical protein LINGRAHAP2_LOCUS24387 [Linum grandiflorum]
MAVEGGSVSRINGLKKKILNR